MTLRILQGAGLIAALALLTAAAFWSQSSAWAYSASQAEAQSDPFADPYSFPNINLCCKERPHYKHKQRKWRRGRWDGDYDGHWGGWERDVVHVSCRGDDGYMGRFGPRHGFSSLAEALDAVEYDGLVRIAADGACRIDGLHIDRPVTIETDDYGSGVRAQLVGGGGCLNISAPGSARVAIRGLDIDGCVQVNGGWLELNEVNVAWRQQSEAIRVLRGSLSTTETTVRSLGPAVDVQRGLVVSLINSGFASTPDSPVVVHLGVQGGTMRGSIIKGGNVGLAVGMTGREPMKLSQVQIVRGERFEHAGLGRAGIDINSGFDDGLPSLPGLASAVFDISDSVVAGYADGIAFGPGSSARATGVTVSHPVRGFLIARGANVALERNIVEKSRQAGIFAEPGAAGIAARTDIEAKTGDCVCYGDNCTSRSDKEFADGLFRIVATRCDD